MNNITVTFNDRGSFVEINGQKFPFDFKCGHINTRYEITDQLTVPFDYCELCQICGQLCEKSIGSTRFIKHFDNDNEEVSWSNNLFGPTHNYTFLPFNLIFTILAFCLDLEVIAILDPLTLTMNGESLQKFKELSLICSKTSNVNEWYPYINYKNWNSYLPYLLRNSICPLKTEHLCNWNLSLNNQNDNRTFLYFKTYNSMNWSNSQIYSLLINGKITLNEIENEFRFGTNINDVLISVKILLYRSYGIYHNKKIIEEMLSIYIKNLNALNNYFVSQLDNFIEDILSMFKRRDELANNTYPHGYILLRQILEKNDCYKTKMVLDHYNKQQS